MKSDTCPHCGGEGKIATDVFDPDSGQMMRGVGEETCICQEQDEEDEQ